MHSALLRHSALALATGALLALPSCLSYHARFEREVAAAAGKYEKPPGPWEGRWKSNHNGHEGPLWCLVSENPDQPGHHDFRYRAGWGIIRFGQYTHTVPTEKTPAGDLKVKGEMDLPKWVGTYSLDGTVSSTKFDAKYTSTTGDHGVMTLRRPMPEKE